MKKTWKIAIITFVSLLAIILISISVLVWIVFTPAKITPIVNTQINKYLNCKTEVGAVELTFYSTFPEFGLKINDFKLINPMKGSANDTLLNSKELVASIDFEAFWKRDEIIIHKIKLKDLSIKAYVNELGKANFDVYTSDSQDTTQSENPFKIIEIQKLAFENANIKYDDLQSKMHASLNNFNGNLNLALKNDDLKALFDFSSPSISFSMDSIEYLKKADINIETNIQYQLQKSTCTIHDLKLNWNSLMAHLKGNIDLSSTNGDIFTDLEFSTENHDIPTILALVPKEYTSSLEGISLLGKVATKGTVKGKYNEHSMPIIDITTFIEEGKFAYTDLPLKLHDMFGNADIHLDLNNEKASKLIINDIKANTDRSNIEANGLIDYIMAEDMLIDLNIKTNFDLLDLKPFLPTDMNMALSGKADGIANIRFMLSDAMNMNIEKLNIYGDFDTNKLDIQYDSLSMYSDNAKIKVKMPNNNTKAKFMKTDVFCEKLSIRNGKNTEANLQNTKLNAEFSNLMETEKLNNILCNFSAGQATARMDNMLATMDAPKGNLAVKMNFSDSTSVPNVVCKFDVVKLNASMDTTSMEMQYPNGTFNLSGDPKQKDQMLIGLKLNSVNTMAKNGNQVIKAKTFIINSEIAEDKQAKNAMMQWIPTGVIELTDGKVITESLKADIEIPVLKFDFKNDVYSIKDSKFTVDNSDFKLVGKVWNVADYMNDKGLLKADFDFSSNTTDVYRLMELTNGFGELDTASIEIAKDQNISTSTQTEQSTGPYMVPKGMDLKLHARINEVLLGYDSAKNVLGDLYVKDGTLILEDMQFITSAAKMQLTAMYRTPRKNHLFVGMDFHMMDMEIGEMLKMIPDIDTIMPMLRSFGGKGEFHIAVETYLDSMYNMKKSTLRGVSSVKGENLTLMDGETFSEIAKTLKFNKKTENRVDSLSAEFTIFKNEVDIYPFLIVMDKYKAVVAGRHNLDMTFDYHISVTESPFPFKLGIDIKGNPDNMKYYPAKCKYANLYRPVARKEIDNKQLEIRKMIRDALTKEVVIK